MAIDPMSVFEQTIASVIAVFIAWGISLVASETSRRFSRSIWRWLLQRWRFVVVSTYIVIIACIVYFVFFSWTTALVVTCCIILTLLTIGFVSRNPPKEIIFYDFRKPMQLWKASDNWNPEIDLVKGVKINPHLNLAKYLISPHIDFSIGFIEYDLILEKNAILNVIFRGKINSYFIMARVDSRITSSGGFYDCILYSPKGGIDWEVYNKAKGQSGHTSPSDEALNVKIECTRRSVKLFVNGYIVDYVDNIKVDLAGDQIVIFAEEASAYVQKMQIIKLS